MKKRKKVFLYAYDKINLGDDLFVRMIVNRYTDARFYLWTDVINKKTFKELSNLKILDKNSLVVKILEKIRPSFAVRYKQWWEKRCDVLVYIGGSIFIEYDNWKNQITWLDYMAERHKFYVLGANFGPYKNISYKEELNKVFSKMQDVCMRDSYSKNLFRNNNSVRLAPDILFGYKMPNISMRKKQIFVSVINCSKREGIGGISEFDEFYMNNLTKILKEYLRDNYQIILASFCKEEGDEIAIEKIFNQLGDNPEFQIKRIYYNGLNTEEILRDLAESKYIIASRFHATVLSLVANRPVLPIIYSDKTVHILEDLEFNGIMLDIRNEESWDYKSSRYNLDNQIVVSLENIVEKSQKHFEKLDQVLGKKTNDKLNI